MRPKLVVLGASGHAKVVLELLEADRRWEVIGCTSAAGEEATVLGQPVVGTDDSLSTLYASGVRCAFAAIGDNLTRRAVTHRAGEIGFTFVNAVSPGAVISRSTQLGNGVAVMAGAVVNADSRLADGVIVNTGASVDHDCRLGPFAHVAPGARLAGCVKVGEGAFLGIGCSVLPGIRVGSWSTVGAGTVVVRDVPCGATVVGVPGRVIKLNAKPDGYEGKKVHSSLSSRARREREEIC